MKLILNEALFEDDNVVTDTEEIVEEPTQEEVVETPIEEVEVTDADVDALANEIRDDIVGEMDTISEYQDTIAEAERVAPEMVPILQDVVEEENVHVGQLQTALELIDNTAEKVEEGEDEAKEQLDGESDVIEDEIEVDFIPDDDVEELI